MSSKILILFDLDGTLTEPRQPILAKIKSFLYSLKQKKIITTGMVGGSNLAKQKEQLGPDLFELFDYIFSENGLVAYHRGRLIHQQSLVNFLGEEKTQFLLNRLLTELGKINLPFKRGSFIEFRIGMLNVSPPGRDVTFEERKKFIQYDQDHHVRRHLINQIRDDLTKLNLVASTGGQISIDIYPIGWDKTYSLRHVKDQNFDKIYFFGDKVEPGGNDHEIYMSAETIGFQVSGPEETLKICQRIF